MAISKENRDFIDSLIDYYISESASYRQIAENFAPEVESIPDTTFGIITGCAYAGFLQIYQSRQQVPSVEDVQEFNQIIKQRAALIKKSVIGQSKDGQQYNQETSEQETSEQETSEQVKQDSAT